jgi:GNAT superfamily N-acetyltransferase
MARLGAQVVAGVGFLGAGTILVTGRREVKGLTTAAGLWASACMGLAIGAGVHRGAWLEDFVVDRSTQGTGVGSKLWDVLLEWCRSHDAHKLDFTSRPTKVAAQQFYLKRGAVVRDTNYFRVTIA